LSTVIREFWLSIPVLPHPEVMPMIPRRWRACVATGVVVLAMAALTGCRGGGPAGAAEAAGCTVVLTEYQDLGTRSVMSISADECCRVAAADGSSALLSVGAAQDLLAQAVWASRAPRFDSVYATVYRAAEEPRFRFSQSREIGRDELTARWGPRPESLDTAAPWRAADHLLWLVFPVVWLAVPIGIILIARKTRPREYLIIPMR
jgi:hypothetical protein